jgi:hypothetical protein
MSSPSSASTPPTIAGCPALPANNIWNARVDQLPVHPRSADYIASIGLNTGLKADFGAGVWNGGPIGIPYTPVPATQPKVAVTFDYADESDPGPYPIPPNPPIEGGPNSTGDRHVLVVDQGNCVLYELFSAYPNGDGTWHAGSGAIFPLTSNALRPAGWTSADAAGLPILTGLARYDEVASGEINHALRFTASTTQRAYLWPARHYASSNTNPSVPPMGIRVRLKSNVDISGFSPANRVILQALKTYGMFLADNGSNWFISGVPDSRWNDDDLRALRFVLGSSFEVVDESSLMIDVNSGQAAQPGGATNTPTSPPSAVPSATHTRTATPTRTLTPTLTPGPASTGWIGPSANAAVTSGSGDNNGFQGNASNAYTDGGGYATDNNSGTSSATADCANPSKDRHVYSNFSLSVPPQAAVRGVEVRLDAWANSSSQSPRMCVEISTDGGLSWTAPQTTGILGSSQATYILGGPTATWGRSGNPAWSVANFAPGNFRVRITNVATSTSRDFRLDWVAARVHYQP